MKWPRWRKGGLEERTKGVAIPPESGSCGHQMGVPLGELIISPPSSAGQNKEKPPPVPNPDYEVPRDREGEGSF